MSRNRFIGVIVYGLVCVAFALLVPDRSVAAIVLLAVAGPLIVYADVEAVWAVAEWRRWRARRDLL